MNNSPQARLRLLVSIVAFALFAAACSGDATVLAGDTSATSSDASGLPQATEPAVDPDSDSVATGGRAAPTATAVPDLEIVTPVPVAVETPTAAPTFEPTVVGTGGASQARGSVSFTMGQTFAGATDIAAFVEGSLVQADDTNWLITEIDIETGVGTSWSVAPSNFALETPDGTIYEAETLYDSSDSREFSVQFVGRTSVDLRVSFPTQVAITDTTGWHLVVRGGDSPATLIPLSGSAYNSEYPLVLADGIEQVVSVESSVGCEAGADYLVTVEGIRIDVEGPGKFRKPLRVPANERLVVADLAITGLAVNGSDSSLCGYTAAWDEFVLLVDGRPSQPFFDDQDPDIDGFSTGALGLSYQVPADATTLELVSGANVGSTTIASWQVLMPKAVGEQGAALVPFGESPEVAPRQAAGERPTELVSNEIAQGGATGNMLFVDYTIGASTATTADPSSAVTRNAKLDEDGRTWVIVEVELENTSQGRWNSNAADYVLEDPQGRPHGGQLMFDRTGERTYTLSLDGPEFKEARVAFETNGMVTDPTGWQVLVHNGDDVAVVLPLAAPAPELPFPIALNTGAPAQVGTDPFSFCEAGGALDLEIEEAKIDIEGPMNFDRWGRTSDAKRFVIVEVKVTNIQTEGEGNNLCGLLPIWPELLLDVDGRLTRAFRHDLPNLQYLESGRIRVNYEIPTETQTIALVAGSGRQVVATWDLKDPSEVLQDFGATVREGQTVITLDQQVLFAFGSSTLQQSATAPLTRVASIVNSESSGQVEIVGHTDSVGDDASNQALSLARAEAVAAALEQAGVDPSRLVVSGQGESSPVAPNENDDGTDNPAGRERNRRVEISFTADS